MGKRHKLVGGVLLCLALAAAGCGKADKAMPVAKEAITAYRGKLVESRDRITAKDRDQAGKSPDGTKKLFAQTFVEPMEKLGYSYDKTVRQFAESLEQGKLAASDPETRTQVEGFLLMAKSTGDYAANNGFITPETKQALDRIHTK